MINFSASRLILHIFSICKDGITPQAIAKEAGKEDIVNYLSTAKKSYSTTV